MRLRFTSELNFSCFAYFFIQYVISSRDIVARELKSALKSIKCVEQGVYVQASTLGSLEALLEFLKTSKIPVSRKNIFFAFELN